MNGFETTRSNYHIALILLYLNCYETITPPTNSQHTYFIQKNPQWLIQYISQSKFNHDVLKSSNIDTKHTRQKISNRNLFNTRPNHNIIVAKYTSKANEYISTNKPDQRISAEAFASYGVPKYIGKTTTIKSVQSFVTAIDKNKWWAQYFRTLEKKYPLLEADKSHRIKNSWEPTRTSHPILLYKWSRTVTRTPVLKDVGQHQKEESLAKDDKVRSLTFKPSTYTMNQEPHIISQELINAVNIDPETEKSLLSWREYDMMDINETRHIIKGPHRSILKSVLIL